MSINWLKIKLIPKRSPKLAWGSLLGIGGLLYLKVWLPATGIGIPCVFHELTGLYCPGCGATRAVLSMLTLNFYQAFRFSPLLFIVLPLYITYTIADKKRMKRTSHVIMAVMLTATLAFGLLRNLPAFEYLAPTLIQ